MLMHRFGNGGNNADGAQIMDITVKSTVGDITLKGGTSADSLRANWKWWCKYSDGRGVVERLPLIRLEI